MRDLVSVTLLLLGLTACERSILHDIPVREPPTPPETTCAPDGSPTGLSAIANDRGVSVAFSDTATNEDGLLIERRGSTGEAWVELTRLGPDATQYSDRDVENDRSYYYRIKAYRIVNGQWCESLPTDSDPVLTLPHVPANFRTGEVADNREILLLWDDTNQLETGYRLERREMGQAAYVVAVELTSNSTSYTDRGRTPGAIYDYQLTALNGSGQSMPVQLSARASAAPQLSWVGEPWLEEGSCRLVVPGTATYDEVLGAVFASSSGTVTKSFGEVLASEAGLEATIDDQTPGPFDIEWSIVDSLGSRGTLTRRLSLDVHAGGQTVAAPRAPRASMGEDYLVGRQASLPGCANCTGRRGSLSTAASSSCSLNADGTVSCWGNNFYGYLASGDEPYEVEFVEPCRGEDCSSPLVGAVAVSAGVELACAILSNGEARCWSETGFEGELGNGSFTGSSGTPVTVCSAGDGTDGTCVPRTDFITTGGPTISVGEGFACGIIDAGRATSVACWGRNVDGSVGNGVLGSANNQAHALPVCASGSRQAGNCVPLGDVVSVQVSSGEDFACALLENGRVRCWGDNAYQYLGVGGPDALPSPYSLTNARYDVCETGRVDNGTCIPLEDVQSLAVGDGHSCVLLADGRVKCWGYGGSRFGVAGQTVSETGNPIPICASGNYVGATGTCTDGVNPDTSLAEVVELGVGNYHGCVIAGASRQVLCWGANTYGRIGDGTETDRLYPTPVCMSGNVDDFSCVPMLGASKLEVRFDHACADVGGTTYCWGDDTYGELGHGNADDNEHLNPVPMCASGTRASCSPLTGVSEVALGESFSCVLQPGAVASEDRVRCVGRNYELQLGRGDYSRRLTAGQACVDGAKWTCQPLSSVVALASGDRHTCAVLEDGSLRCFGYNGAGQLGLGVFDYQDGRRHAIPVCERGTFDGTSCLDGGTPSELTGVVAVTAGTHHTCVLLAGGRPLCFGLNGCGQLGNGQTGNCVDPDTLPDDELESEPIESLPVELCSEGGATQTCAPLTGGVVSMSAGHVHTCMIMETGEAMCFGKNDVGQLGSGEPAPVHANPVRVCASDSGSGCPPLTGVIQLALGNRHSCALLDDGTARCWGDNTRAQLGDGTTTSPRLNPVRVCRTGFGGTCDPLSNIVAITAGDNFNCALIETGEVYCWGSNEGIAGAGFVGTLGAGTSVNQSSLPLRVCAPGSATTCEEQPACSAPLSDAVAVSAGETHVCAERANGTVVCWGEELSFGIGIGSFGAATDYCVPVQVCQDGVDTSCPTQLGNQAVATCDILRVNVLEEP